MAYYFSYGSSKWAAIDALDSQLYKSSNEVKDLISQISPQKEISELNEKLISQEILIKRLEKKLDSLIDRYNWI